MGVEGEGKVSEWAKLEPGMGVRLFDEGLGEKNDGFEKVWLFGIIGKPYGREPGYHVFWLEPHLFTITRHPVPVRISAALIAPPLVTLPPLDLVLPHKKSVFDWLLEGQQNEKVGDRSEFDYVAVTGHSPLHRTTSQRTPAWIVTHMGIEGEGKVSESAKLELGIGVQLFDEGLSRKNYGFEKVWIFGTIRKTYGQEPGYHIY